MMARRRRNVRRFEVWAAGSWRLRCPVRCTVTHAIVDTGLIVLVVLVSVSLRVAGLLDKGLPVPSPLNCGWTAAGVGRARRGRARGRRTRRERDESGAGRDAVEVSLNWTGARRSHVPQVARAPGTPAATRALVCVERVPYLERDGRRQVPTHPTDDDDR